MSQQPTLSRDPQRHCSAGTSHYTLMVESEEREERVEGSLIICKVVMVLSGTYKCSTTYEAKTTVLGVKLLLKKKQHSQNH